MVAPPGVHRSGPCPIPALGNACATQVSAHPPLSPSYAGEPAWVSSKEVEQAALGAFRRGRDFCFVGAAGALRRRRRRTKLPSKRFSSGERLYVSIGGEGIEVVVSLSGELDMTTAAVLRTVLAGAIECAPGRLVLDVAEVTFVDCAALRVFAWARRQLHPGGQLVIRKPRPIVIKLLDLIGLAVTLDLDGELAPDGGTKPSWNTDLPNRDGPVLWLDRAPSTDSTALPRPLLSRTESSAASFPPVTPGPLRTTVRPWSQN